MSKMTEIEVVQRSDELVEVFVQGQRNKVKLGPCPSEEPLIPALELKYDPDKREPYTEFLRTKAGKNAGERLLVLREWLKNPMVCPAGMNDKEYTNFMRFSSVAVFLNKQLKD